MDSPERTEMVAVKTFWCDRKRAPTVQVVRAPLVQDRVVELELALDLRTVDRVEITPVRRPMLDVAGTVADAERLANEEPT